MDTRVVKTTLGALGTIHTREQKNFGKEINTS